MQLETRKTLAPLFIFHVQLPALKDKLQMEADLEFWIR